MALQKLHILQGEMHDGRDEKHLGGDGSAGSLEPVKNHPLMGGVLVDEDQIPAALHKNIGMERLPQNPVVRNRRYFRIRNGTFPDCFFLTGLCMIDRLRRVKGERRGRRIQLIIDN